MAAPLYNKLIKYSKENIPFHMPGHKFGTVASFDQIDMSMLDNTEALGMDNLYEAKGVIKEAMELMAQFYGTDKTIFLTNGSTAGILTSIMATCRQGDQFIVARNAHHSVWSALVLAGVSPIYINTEYLQSSILGEMKKETVEKALKEYPNAKGIIIVSPTYEGIVSNIAEIAEVVHNYNKVLIVDEAHGAHFVLGESFPQSAVEEGADIVINSTHKTLPALTQSALLHICSNRVSYEQIITNLRMIQTSSPSYVMMGLMDYVRQYIEDNRKNIYDLYISPLKQLRNTLSNKLIKLKLLEYLPGRYDISKIIILTDGANIDGYQLSDLLYERYKITIEAALEDYVIIMTTMADTKESLRLLERALIEIDTELEIIELEKETQRVQVEEISYGNNPRDIFYREKEWLSIEKCLQRIVSKNIMLYPPGIPIVAIGETISEEKLKLILRYKDKLQGVKREDNQLLIEVIR